MNLKFVGDSSPSSSTHSRCALHHTRRCSVKSGRQQQLNHCDTEEVLLQKVICASGWSVECCIAALVPHCLRSSLKVLMSVAVCPGLSRKVCHSSRAADFRESIQPEAGSWLTQTALTPCTGCLRGANRSLAGCHILCSALWRRQTEVQDLLSVTSARLNPHAPLDIAGLPKFSCSSRVREPAGGLIGWLLASCQQGAHGHIARTCDDVHECRHRVELGRSVCIEDGDQAGWQAAREVGDF